MIGSLEPNQASCQPDGNCTADFWISSTCHCDILKAFEWNCSQFIQCSNNILYFMNCPKWTLFSEDSQRCDWPYNVNCDNQMSTTTMTPRSTTEQATTPKPTTAPPLTTRTTTKPTTTAASIRPLLSTVTQPPSSTTTTATTTKIPTTTTTTSTKTNTTTNMATKTTTTTTITTTTTKTTTSMATTTTTTTTTTTSRSSSPKTSTAITSTTPISTQTTSRTFPTTTTSSDVTPDFLQESPITMLSTEFIANRYNVSESGFRINVSNGYVSFEFVYNLKIEFQNCKTKVLFTHLKIIGNLLVTNFFIKDQIINLTYHEKLNEFPSTILILNPGGCALYEFPIKMDQIHMFIKAAKKPKLVSKTRSKIIIRISTFESLYLRIVSSS